MQFVCVYLIEFMVMLTGHVALQDVEGAVDHYNGMQLSLDFL